jgi:TolA-binding protein
MDSASDLGEDSGNSGTAALQEREAAIKQVVGMLQVLGATSPLEALKAAGLAGVSLDEDKAKGEPVLSHGDRLAQDAAKLKRLADQRRAVQKQIENLEETIQRQQMRLASLHSVLATLEKDYAETAATCAPAGAKRVVGTGGSAHLESMLASRGSPGPSTTARS